MILRCRNITVRSAEPADAAQLAAWWNDGELMAQAGYPHGTGQTAESIEHDIRGDADGTHRRLMIELDDTPIGEAVYYRRGETTAEIGIKICVPS